ncbi:MAG: HAD-IA family hydrolase [Synergistaceae bacterium]|jgi:HAD superfamily hydrolase (TIGR01509 family)|nr:HAD-IA family hydrolase [Synergistaceae bacterium]
MPLSAGGAFRVLPERSGGAEPEEEPGRVWALIKLLIFDHDMTLVDSSQAIVCATNMVGKKLGKPPVTREAALRYIALPLWDVFVGLWGDCKQEWIDLYRENAESVEHELIRPFPDVPPTLLKLHETGIFLAVASNRRNPRAAMDKSRTSQYFDAIVGPDDGLAFKPDPAMLRSLMKRFDAAAAETLYVGDSGIDVKTGIAAGVRPVGVATGNFTRGELLGMGAWRALDSMSELPPLVAAEPDIMEMKEATNA